MQVILDRLSLLFRARYPLVHLITHEEERVERALEKLAGRENMAVYRWRGTTGLSGPGGPVEGTEAFQAMLGALSAVSVPAMFLCFDPHPYLSDPSSVRRLRDLAHAVGSRNQAVVLVGPELRVPIELDKELTVLDVPTNGIGIGGRFRRRALAKCAHACTEAWTTSLISPPSDSPMLS